jgi:hypothetical protein
MNAKGCGTEGAPPRNFTGEAEVNHRIERQSVSARGVGIVLFSLCRRDVLYVNCYGEDNIMVNNFKLIGIV